MHRIFEISIEICGWIQIVLSPTLIGIVLGYSLYYYYPNNNVLIVSILIAVIGFIIGLFWATKKFKTTGTINFLSRISATPELDTIENSKVKKNDLI